MLHICLSILEYRNGNCRWKQPNHTSSLATSYSTGAAVVSSKRGVVLAVNERRTHLHEATKLLGRLGGAFNTWRVLQSGSFSASAMPIVVPRGLVPTAAQKIDNGGGIHRLDRDSVQVGKTIAGVHALECRRCSPTCTPYVTHKVPQNDEMYRSNS